jgi:hypothetical protein
MTATEPDAVLLADQLKPGTEINEGKELGHLEASLNQTNRPTGRIPIILAYWCGAFGFFALITAFSVGPNSLEMQLLSLTTSPDYISNTYRDIVNKRALQFVFFVASGSFASLCFLFWAVGYIVRAISFLPRGKEVNE